MRFRPFGLGRVNASAAVVSSGHRETAVSTRLDSSSRRGFGKDFLNHEQTPIESALYSRAMHGFAQIIRRKAFDELVSSELKIASIDEMFGVSQITQATGSRVKSGRFGVWKRSVENSSHGYLSRVENTASGKSVKTQTNQNGSETTVSFTADLLSGNIATADYFADASQGLRTITSVLVETDGTWHLFYATVGQGGLQDYFYKAVDEPLPDGMAFFDMPPARRRDELARVAGLRKGSRIN